MEAEDASRHLLGWLPERWLPDAGRAGMVFGLWLRGLLLESVQAILRSHDPLAQWGKKLLARKGSVKLVAGVVTRKLAEAVWYRLVGRWTPLEEIGDR